MEKPLLILLLVGLFTGYHIRQYIKEICSLGDFFVGQQCCQRLRGLCFFCDKLKGSGIVQVPSLDSDGNLAAEICFYKLISMDLASLPSAVILTDLYSAIKY